MPKLSALPAISAPALGDKLVETQASTTTDGETTIQNLITLINANQPLIWWQELGRATSAGGVTTLSVGSFAACTYLRFIMVVLPAVAYNSGRLQFNGDTGASNYPYRVATNGAADTTGATNGVAVDVGNASQASPTYTVVDIVNVLAQEKVYLGQGSDAGASGTSGVPNRRELAGKWANTSAQITSATLATATTLNSGSALIVLGHN